MLNEVPAWCYRTDAHVLRALNELSKADLLAAVRMTKPDQLVSKHKKSDMVNLIVHDFVQRRQTLLNGDGDDSSAAPNVICGHRVCRITRVFNDRYGITVADALRRPVCETDFEQAPNADQGLLTGMSYQDMHLSVQCLPKHTLIDCLHHIPSHVRPNYNSRSVRSCSSALVDHIRRRIQGLISLSDIAFLDVRHAVCSFDCSSNESRSVLIDQILCHEYGVDISQLLHDPVCRGARNKKLTAELQNYRQSKMTLHSKPKLQNLGCE
jgi:hypothetical protein